MNNPKMKFLFITAMACAMVVNINAQTLLTEGHTDLGVAYELGEWNLHIGQHEATPPMEYAPDEAILGVDILAAGASVPPGASWSFLGTEGASVWILPQVHNPELLFLGLGTEELPSGIFVNDQVRLTLTGVRGPGEFSMYEVDMFGNPNVFMTSEDGLTTADSLLLIAGGHRHVNWAFSAPGTYELDFEASGTLVDGELLSSSGPETYTFSIAAVPEPGVLSLLLLCGGVMMAFVRAGKTQS